MSRAEGPARPARVTIGPDDLAPACLRRWAARTPEQVFLEHVDGRRLTYAQVGAQVDRWGSALAAAGLGPGEHVAMLVADHFEAAVVWLGVTSAGLVAVPLNTASKGRLLRHALDTSRAAAVVVSPDLADRLPEVLARSTVRRVVVLGDRVPEVLSTGAPSVESVAAAALTAEGRPGLRAEPGLHDTAMLMFTSGTTGPSKAVIVPWAASHSHWSWVPPDTLAEGEALYTPLTMFHNSGLGALQYTLWKGGRLVLRDRFSASAFWDDVRACGAVAAGLVGPMTAVLWSAPPRPDDADNPLRAVILGPMIEQMAAFEERFGVKVATCYGMTEVPAVVGTGWDHGPWRTCGVVLDGWPWPEVMLVDDHDQPVAPGTVGQMVVRTRAPWALNAGYYGNPEATAEAWRNGWFHTGDAFVQDEEGRFIFLDRMKDAIRRRGENISSFEVESLVLEHPAVAECAAFAVPDGFGGDDVMVAVVPVDPAAPPERDEFFAFCERTMPAYMVPRYVDVVAELPRNTTSLRVQKVVLRERGVTPTSWDRGR